MNKVLTACTGAQKKIESFFQTVCLVCGAGLFLLLSGNVFIRIFPVVSLHWFGEIVELLFAWLVFLGAAVLYSRKDHFMIDWLYKKTEGTPFGAPYRIAISVICLIFSVTLFVEGYRLTRMAHDWTSVLHMPRRWFYLSMPVGGGFMVYASLIELAEAFFGKKPDKK